LTTHADDGCIANEPAVASTAIAPHRSTLPGATRPRGGHARSSPASRVGHRDRRPPNERPVTQRGVKHHQAYRRKTSALRFSNQTSEAPVTGSRLCDSDIRTALLDRLQQRHQAEPDVAFLEELGLCRGQVFVDVTVVNGALHGYEIKSDRDSLRRLAGQVAFYGRVLDRATLVVGTRHLADADEV